MTYTLQAAPCCSATTSGYPGWRRRQARRGTLSSALNEPASATAPTPRVLPVARQIRFCCSGEKRATRSARRRNGRNKILKKGEGALHGHQLTACGATTARRRRLSPAPKLGRDGPRNCADVLVAPDTSQRAAEACSRRRIARIAADQWSRCAPWTGRAGYSERSAEPQLLNNRRVPDSSTKPYGLRLAWAVQERLAGVWPLAVLWQAR